MLAVQAGREAMDASLGYLGHEASLFGGCFVLDSVSLSKRAIATHYYPTTEGGWCPNLKFSVLPLCSPCLCGEYLLKAYSPQRHRAHGGFTEKLKLGHYPNSATRSSNDGMRNTQSATFCQR